MIDENVHFRHTARLMNALNSAQKRYDILIFPTSATCARRGRPALHGDAPRGLLRSGPEMKRAAPDGAARRESIGAFGSDLADVGGGRSPSVLLDLELHRITLGERPEPLGLDRRVMDEDVFASVVRGNETVPFTVV